MDQFPDSVDEWCHLPGARICSEGTRLDTRVKSLRSLEESGENSEQLILYIEKMFATRASQVLSYENDVAVFGC